MPDATAARTFLCEPAQWKCTWLTFHKSHFVWKFTRKMLNATDTTSIEHRSLTPTVRPGPSVWQNCLGEKIFLYAYAKKSSCLQCLFPLRNFNPRHVLLHPVDLQNHITFLQLLRRGSVPLPHHTTFADRRHA